MKLSKRELILLTLLMIIALVFIEFRFVITPGLNNFYKLQDEQMEVTSEVDQVKLNIASLATNQKKLQTNLDEIGTLSNPYFDGLKPDVLLNFSRDIILRNGLTIFVYTANPIQVMKIDLPEGEIKENLYTLKELARKFNNNDGTGNEGADQSPSSPSPETADDLELFKVNISATGTYDQMKSLLTEIEQMNRSIRVNDLTLNVGQLAGALNANFTLEFYGLEKLVPNNADNLTEWPREAFDGGTNNPYPVPVTVQQ